MEKRIYKCAVCHQDLNKHNHHLSAWMRPLAEEFFGRTLDKYTHICCDHFQEDHPEKIFQRNFSGFVSPRAGLKALERPKRPSPSPRKVLHTYEAFL